MSFLRAGVERIGGDVDARRGAARRGDHGERTGGTGAGAAGRRAGAVEGGDRVVFAGAGEEFVEAAARARGARGGEDAFHRGDDGDGSAAGRRRGTFAKKRVRQGEHASREDVQSDERERRRGRAGRQ